jgi:hypothetical protein
MAPTSKVGPSLSPVVVFLLGAASATALVVFFVTSAARPAWPALEAGAQRRGEVPGSATVRCSTPRANGTAGAEQHAGVTAPPANDEVECITPC